MSFIWPLNTIYIHETLHKSLVVAASVLFLNQLATMLGSLIGGKLFDTWSPYYSILLGIILNIFALGDLFFSCLAGLRFIAHFVWSCKWYFCNL